MKTQLTFSVTAGDVVTVDVLEWIDPYWEFDNPTVVLAPIYREFETTHTEGAIEDVLLDICCDETAPIFIGGIDGPRRWNVATLKRRFREAIAGKEFPERNYRAQRVKVRIVREADYLTWEEIVPEVV